MNEKDANKLAAGEKATAASRWQSWFAAHEKWNRQILMTLCFASRWWHTAIETRIPTSESIIHKLLRAQVCC